MPGVTLLVVATAKNEGHIVREWVAHYKSQGVQHFLIVDNGSTDNTRAAFEKHVGVKVITDPKQHSQVDLYNRHGMPALQKLIQAEAKAEAEAEAEAEASVRPAPGPAPGPSPASSPGPAPNRGSDVWVLVVDLDEFVFGNEGQTIAEVLASPVVRAHPEIGRIDIPWAMFGSSGHVKQPKSVRQGFTRRRAYPDGRPINEWHKCVARGIAVDSLQIHETALKPGFAVWTEQLMPALYAPDHSMHVQTEGLLASAALRLNHYIVQSKEFFQRVKMTRGDNVDPAKNSSRDWKYFAEYDHNDVVDSSLVGESSFPYGLVVGSSLVSVFLLAAVIVCAVVLLVTSRAAF